MLEFTGERVIPGQVEPDLWNEHLARYLFAARMANGKRVADLGCGSGYGAAELGKPAKSVTGFDVSPEAIAHARGRYGSPAVSFVEAPCEAIPSPNASFDLVVAFEVIEHLADHRALVREARRILASGGQFVVSTPNHEYYAATRRTSGPNPYHVREFSLPEFRELLTTEFEYVTLYTQNHAEALVVRSITEAGGEPTVRIEGAGSPETAHFFIAVCALSPQIESPAFLYLPSSANVLRERELHIGRLEGELATKQEWLDKSLAAHSKLVEQFRAQKEELESVNEWVKKLDAELADKIAHVQVLQTEVDSLTAELAAKVDELGRAVALLHSTESDLEARTNWALNLEREKLQLIERMKQAADSRFMRLGRILNVGPDLKS